MDVRECVRTARFYQRHDVRMHKAGWGGSWRRRGAQRTSPEEESHSKHSQMIKGFAHNLQHLTFKLTEKIINFQSVISELPPPAQWHVLFCFFLFMTYMSFKATGNSGKGVPLKKAKNQSLLYSVALSALDWCLFLSATNKLMTQKATIIIFGMPSRSDKHLGASALPWLQQWTVL